MSDATLKHELLRGPLLKIERAKHHVRDLHEKIDEYLALKPVEFWISQSKKPPQRTVYTKAEPPIPEVFGLIVGDAVNNMRSALDHICFAMVNGASMGTKDRRLVGFPFAKDANDLNATIAQRKMDLAPVRVINELHALEPYPAGDKYLNAIQGLSNSDKHHSIMTAVTGAEMTWLQLQEFLPPDKLPEHAPNTGVRTLGWFCSRLDPNSDIEIFDKKASSQPTVLLGFGQGEALENDPLVTALEAMTISAEAAARRLARAYFA